MMIKRPFFSAFGMVLATVLASCAPEPTTVAVATPDEIKTEIEASTAPLVLIHVWATWCDPCRAEFPELLEVYRHFENQGMELVLISADDPSGFEAVEKFLKEQNCPVGCLIASELSQKFIETLSPVWAGSLPSSFFYAKGKLLHEWEGTRSYTRYAETIETLLNKHKEVQP